MRTSRAFATIATAAALSLGLAACGSGDSTDDASTSATSSEETTSATSEPSDTATSAEETTEPADAGGGDVSDFVDAYARGLEGMTTATVTTTSTIAGMESTSEGVVDYSVSPPATQMTTTVAGQTVEMIMIDGVIYMNMGATSNNMWVQMDGAAADAAGAGVQTDPLAQMRQFQEAVTDATLVGQEDVNGVQADHWSVTLDLSAISLGASPEGTDAVLPDAVTYDVWLDGEGRSVRTVMDFEVAGQATSTETLMSNFGEPVTIEAPAADQITTMPGIG